MTTEDCLIDRTMEPTLSDRHNSPPPMVTWCWATVNGIVSSHVYKQTDTIDSYKEGFCVIIQSKGCTATLLLFILLLYSTLFAEISTSLLVL